MHADRGGTSDNEDEDGDDDDTDKVDGNDVFDDDILPATQLPALPSLLSQVYNVESPDNEIPDISCDRGDPNHPTIPEAQHNCIPDPNVECPSHT